MCDRTYGLKRAAGAHERLFTVICAIVSFLYLCLLLIHSAVLAYVLDTGLGALFIVFLETAIALKEDLEISLLRIFFIFTLSLCTGIGTIGAVMLGVFIHREKISARKAPVISHNFKRRDAEINLEFWRI
ncbi:hypothetical protein [uncultured Campylobacter sp.]|uniref:hypothetical protein n=1 Tax=uncultured Campylobacter sp. TaxID=218934 RepID=UPI00262E671F|nr:hypothetical protein [uncultured Campylobacter sp.]